MSSLVTKLSEGREAAVDLAEVFCPICLGILLQPVKMPCDHVLCLSCFQMNMAEATLCCPLCRTRISTWARKAVRNKTLVDQALWSFITRTFPKHVEAAREGKDETDPEEIFPCFAVHQFAEQGDIKSEFDSQLEEEREEREREDQHQLSSELARKMEEEEREEEWQRQRAVQQQELEDKEFARKIRMEGIASTPTSSKKRKNGKNTLIDLLKKSAEKKAKLTKTNEPSSVEKAGTSKEDSDVEINWSDEDFLEEQRQIERKLAQEKEDGELARKLQSEYQLSS